MIICLGPVCVPVWPLLFLLLKPVWNLLSAERQEQIRTWWFGSFYPTWVQPWVEKIPEKVLFCSRCFFLWTPGEF